MFTFSALQSQTIYDHYALEDSIRKGLKESNYDYALKWCRASLKFTEQKLWAKKSKDRDTLVLITPFMALTTLGAFHAMLSNVDSMYYYMNRAVEGGFSSSDVFVNDYEFYHKIYHHDSVVALQSRMDENFRKNEEEWPRGINVDLALRLNQMFIKDQRIRKEYEFARFKWNYSDTQMDSLLAEMAIADSINQTEIVKIIDVYGYPGNTLVGRAGSIAFFVIHHSNYDMQKKYYPLLKEAVNKGELGQELLHALTDRMLLREGHKQKYGTQFRYDENDRKVKATMQN